MAISGGDGSIVLNTKVDTSGVNKGMSSIKGIISKIGGVMAAAFSVSLLTNFGKAAIDLASDLQEVQNVVDTAFGDMSYKIEEFSKTAIEKFGLSELAAKQWASTMMAMGSGMGQSMEIGSDMAVELTGRLADVMSFYNKTEEEAFTLGKAIYSGETEPLKSIGIIMTENNLALFAMSKGYKQAYKDMNAANKLLIRQQFFLEQTSLAAGDYTKTADGWANRTRTLTQRWKEMQATFGETFIAFGVLVLPVIEQIINGLNQIALMARTAAASFGLFKEESKESEKTTNKQVVSSNSIASNIDQQTENQKKLNKELKKGLAGFDEINTLSSETADNTADAGTGTQVSGIGGVGANYDNSFADKIDADLAAIMGAVGFALAAIGIIMICFGHIGWGIGFLIAGAAIFSVSQAALSEGAEAEKVKNIMNGIIAGISLLALVLGIILVATGGSLPLGIGLIIVGAAGLATEVALNWDAIKNGITNFFQNNAGLIVGVSIALIVLGIILLFTGVGIPLAIGLIVAGGGALAATVALNWNFIVDKVKEVWQKVVSFWNAYIAPIFTAKWWADLGKKALNGLITVFEAVLNHITGGFRDLANIASSLINVVGNALGFDWNIPQIPKIKLPRLAKGAVIPPNREFLAVLGDQKNGTNIEAPLDTIVEAFNIALSRNGGNTAQDNRPIVLQIDGREIARATREGNASLGSQTVFGGFANAY